MYIKSMENHGSLENLYLDMYQNILYWFEIKS